MKELLSIKPTNNNKSVRKTTGHAQVLIVSDPNLQFTPDVSILHILYRGVTVTLSEMCYIADYRNKYT